MMKQRPRIYYSDSQKAMMWDRWQKGESLHAIARLFDRGRSSIAGILSITGGSSRLALTLAEREEISRGTVTQSSIRAIAEQLGRSPSTVSREINRNGGYDNYRAANAEQTAWERALRPKRCKLVCNKRLSRMVAKQLKLSWSPQQIAGWLKREYPGNEDYHLSHETIYRSLFIQARGALKKELLQCLRTNRTMRRAKNFSLKEGRSNIANAVSISERPASADDRAIPGHWEVDLLPEPIIVLLQRW